MAEHYEQRELCPDEFTEYPDPAQLYQDVIPLWTLISKAGAIKKATDFNAERLLDELPADIFEKLYHLCNAKLIAEKPE